jgi:hypothetical protein
MIRAPIPGSPIGEQQSEGLTQTHWSINDKRMTGLVFKYVKETKYYSWNQMHAYGAIVVMYKDPPPRLQRRQRLSTH